MTAKPSVHIEESGVLQSIPQIRMEFLRAAAEGTNGLGDGSGGKAERVTARLIPYYAWNNRGARQMRVWLPVGKPLPEEGGSLKE